MKKSEKILLGLFAVLFLLIVGGGGLMLGVNKWRSISRDNEKLRERLVDMNMAITQGVDWQRKSDWIEENVPTMASRQEASSKLLETLQKQAVESGVTLSSKEFVDQQRAVGEDGQPAEATGYFDQASPSGRGVRRYRI